MEDVIFNMILDYIEDQRKTKFDQSQYIEKHFIYDCVLEVIVCPTYLRIQDYQTRFEVIIHSNKNLIKVKYGATYKGEYDYMDLLYNISLINNVNMFYYPKELKAEVLQDLQIHNRTKTIESLLI
jgi:hypothetical protein